MLCLASCITPSYVTDDIYYRPLHTSTVKYYDYYSDAMMLDGLPVILVDGMYYWQIYDDMHHMWYRKPIPREHHHRITINFDHGRGTHYVKPHRDMRRYVERHRPQSRPMEHRPNGSGLHTRPQVPNNHGNHTSQPQPRVVEPRPNNNGLHTQPQIPNKHGNHSSTPPTRGSSNNGGTRGGHGNRR